MSSEYWCISTANLRLTKQNFPAHPLQYSCTSSLASANVTSEDGSKTGHKNLSPTTTVCVFWKGIFRTIFTWRTYKTKRSARPLQLWKMRSWYYMPFKNCPLLSHVVCSARVKEKLGTKKQTVVNKKQS